MAKANNSTGNGDTLYSLLAQADDTYAEIPPRLKMAIEKLAQAMTDSGPRKLRHRGEGTDFFGTHEYVRGVDDPRQINARLSARMGKPIIVERQVETHHHFYLWRDATGSMNYHSRAELNTKKEAAEIMLLAFTKHITKNDELIGILDEKGTYRGARASSAVATQIADASIITGDMPSMGRKLPRNSTAILFSDFMMDPKTLVDGLEKLSGIGLNGYMVMVLDPQEIEFNFKGHMEFNGLEGEGKQAFKKAETLRDKYHQAMRAHVETVKRICESKGFTFIMQRTDEPLHNALLAIYGLAPDAPARSTARAPGPGL